MMKKSSILLLAPVLLTFFVMGAVDLVGIASNYVKEDFGLSDTVANIFPSMVFLWFFLFSVPSGLLMNKVGRKKTVLLSLIVTTLALIVPVVNYNFTFMLISFSLLGIGNTLMQVSLNPLISNVVVGNQLASTLTLGQFVKAIASFAAPIIAGWAALKFGNWRLLFFIYSAITILSFVLLGVTKIKEEPYQTKSSFIGCFRLLGNWQILLFFIGILAHVGIDVGINATAPKIFMERIAGMTLADAGFATSLYFLFRVIGCFLGTFILARFQIHKFFTVSVICMFLSVVGLSFASNLTTLYICIALIGFGNSNIFSMIFSKAIQFMPERNNEVSGLMIMGVSGGAIFPLLMGISSDWLKSQLGAVIIVAILVIYLFSLVTHIKNK
ncbi:L-fucose-proton symporter [termite gut metagenome]|uniref:L-fucose-proton symporter n=1 Tax=termite gut metagenome TaxID=433724 RepID=A0A5J4T4M9_9ZZZZ